MALVGGRERLPSIMNKGSVELSHRFSKLPSEPGQPAPSPFLNSAAGKAHEQPEPRSSDSSSDGYQDKSKGLSHKVMALDQYALKPSPQSVAGAIVTLVVYVATAIYVAMLVVEWTNAPATKTVGTEWTIGFGPAPMRLTCMALSGCLVSNTLTPANTLDVSKLVDTAQTRCVRLPYNTSMNADVVFSVDPTEGLSVLWDPLSAINTTSLRGGGLVIISECRCPAGDDPACIMRLQTPIGPGTALLQHVETVNNTASGAGMHRREWFANTISQDGSVLFGSTPCFDPAHPDPQLAGWTQARLRMNSFYNTVDVSKDSFWLFLFGAAGGAYSVFLQAGALLLLLSALGWKLSEAWQRRRGAVHDSSRVAPAPPANASGSMA